MRAIVNGALLLLFCADFVQGNNSDRFNYGMTDKTENGANSYGQKNWGDVTCSNKSVCAGFPNRYPHFPGYNNLKTKNKSQCKYCPNDKSVKCGLHRQSPIDLKRDRGVDGHPNEKECPDWHWMQYRPDTCTWEDMKSQFTIERHALQIHVPQQNNGDIDCFRWNKRRYPRIDYSKGFPDWWWMQRTDVFVPSNHVQEGVRYAAEVTLAHFYEINHVKNQFGHIAIFMQDYPDAESWPFLDKLICQWRKEEDKVRESCGLPPVEPYGRCALLRNQEPTQEWLDEEAGIMPTGSFPSTSPSSSPTSSPTTSFPSTYPSPEPSTHPSAEPSDAPTEIPTSPPSKTLSDSPSNSLAVDPGDISMSPSAAKSMPPSTNPTAAPSFPGVPEITDGDSAPPSVGTSSMPSPTPTDAPTTAPTLVPSSAPTGEPTGVPSAKPSATPSATPSAPPTKSPTAAPTTTPTDTPSSSPTQTVAVKNTVPEDIDCGRDDRLIERMCASRDPCCESVRSDTRFCWNIYDNVFPGEQIKSACYHCCSEPKIVGDPNPEVPGIPKTLKCSTVENPFRACKENSCCSTPRSKSTFCKETYAAHPNDMDSLCQYCCRVPRTIGPSRHLRSQVTGQEEDQEADGDEEEEEEEEEEDDNLQEGDKVIFVAGKKFILRKENFESDEEEEDEHAYFDKMYADYNRRSLNTVVHEEDYEDIDWFPYEWMIKVGTEYYYRYEGTQLVPPCWEVVHWRAMKDPIRVHKRQIAELHRLLAWRLNPDSCEVDTAGVVSDDGDTVDLSREVMYYESPHRKVFCECKDWPSKFEGDQEWCKNWKSDTNYDRFYKRPYSFDSGGKWHPDE